MSLILGISCFYHDSAAALVRDGKTVLAAQEERFTRVKHDSSFPANAVRFILDSLELRLEDLDAIVYYEKPLLKFERILSMIHSHVPDSRAQFVASMPGWVKQKLFFKTHFWDCLEEVHGAPLSSRPPLLFPEHHLSHAASAFYPSGFEEAAIMVLDGVGEWASMSLGKGEGSKIEFFEQADFPNSLGMLYSAFTWFLGFKINSGEYKLMGLAPYGNPEDDSTKEYIKLIKTNLIEVREDGRFLLNMEWFEYQKSMKTLSTRKWEGLFKINKRNESEPLTQEYMNLALAIQSVTEEVVVKLAKSLKEKTGLENLALCGGVALNCVANGRLRQEKIFKNIWIQPAAGDAGAAIGAALCGHYIFKGAQRDCESSKMKHSFLGPSFSEDQIAGYLDATGASYQKLSCEEVPKVCAQILSEGCVVGWFQGAMEWGPRALGHRSILADPRDPKMQKQLNLKIKFREGFRPFAPIMTQEEHAKLFESGERSSPYMLFVSWLREEHRKTKPPGFSSMDLSSKLYFERSALPAVTHIDYSARAQTVASETDPLTHELLKEFGALTGFEALINTSFNVRGEPIVCSPKDAYLTFMQTEMDYLALGNCLLKKTDQKGWDNPDLWKRAFKAD